MCRRRRRCEQRSRQSACPPCSRPAASAMTARARRSSARATIRTRSGTTSPPNQRSSKPLCHSSARSRWSPRAPAAIPEALAAQARSIAETIANALDYVGVLAVEMFVVQADGGRTVLVNEIAPRVHNSGHWTLDGASISQFEQHIRAIAGWPLGKPVRHGPVVMTNLIGDDIHGYEQWLTVPGATVHLYGKGSPRPGRKMGHVTQVGAAPPKTA